MPDSLAKKICLQARGIALAPEAGGERTWRRYGRCYQCAANESSAPHGAMSRQPLHRQVT